MPFKYKDQHSSLKCVCPPIEKLKPINEKAYRFVHEDINHINNFIPPLVIDPTRIDSFVDCETQCEYYALSLYNDYDRAQTKLSRLVSHKPLIRDVIGDCIAEGNIEENDGLADNPKHGHYNFHEYKAVDLSKKFKIIKKL